ncbi:non-ribosomal peptide synthetase [Prescottella agglutinans]|uniref:Amino acid adenylation domain-containing protein n=1 Tax=Prescottella agglutinans TaxID=1644129 RepID=A0ABT6M870_9NOCA|nr:non-ribosomal peptide synthetase [Prescottella agglutinans]MDH6280518.1 amino acid adenylation domain-containing protein [Prescottella agglutinans]
MRPFPLSPAQRALLFAQQLAPDVALTVAQYLDLHGPLDAGLMLSACERAARDIGSGTVILVDIAGEPHQSEVPDIDDAPHFLDLSGVDDPASAAIDWMTQRTSRPIDPFSDRLAEMTLIRLADDHHFLHCFAHHVVMDGYAAQVLTARIAELYRAAVAGKEAPPNRTASIEEIGRIVEAYETSARAERDRAYWLDKTARLPRGVSLGDRIGPVASPALRSLDALSDATTESLADSSLPEVPAILAAFAVFLARSTGVDEVSLSLPVSARTTAVLRRSAGSVSNVVPIRVRIAHEQSVGDLILDVQVELTGALRHQRFRYDAMLRDFEVGEIQSGVGGVFGPVVNIMQFPLRWSFGDVDAELHILSTGPIDDLSVTIYPAGDNRATRVDFEANPSRYSEESLGRHHRRFLDFLSEFVSDVLRRVGDVDLDRPDAIVRSSTTIESGALLLPDVLARKPTVGGVAVRSGSVEITYAELDARSSALARKLIAHGAGPEVGVGVVLPRSMDSVLALWAVAKTGAAYVPVDPDLPSRRMAQHLAGLTLAIAGRDIELPSGVARVDLGTDGWESTPIADTDRRRPLRPDNAAWVIHTSGSTGRPKPVVVTHRGVAGLVSTLRSRYAAASAERVLHMSSPAFDASVQEILLAADAGATLIVAHENEIGGDALARLLRAEAVTHVVSAPAVLAATSAVELPSLRVLDAGGEVLPVAVAQRWMSGRTMLNAYGPTETTVLAAVSDPIESRTLEGVQSVPIGRPVDGTALAVLDGRLRIVPRGVVGELYVGGPSLARGYGDSPGSTAARFVASVFGPGRMYRTGDLVRRRPDGQLEFVGRIDNQVQVRGVRIELGDIETVLAGHPEVGVAAAILSGDRIAAFVTGTGVDRETLGRWAVERLPRQMVPDRIVVLEALPLTAGGKIDRSALSSIEVTPEGDALGRPVHGQLETLVADTVARLLDTREVSASADFFALGGDSLAASQLAARVSTATGRGISVKDVFEHRTVARLAALAVGRSELPALERSAEGPVPLAPAQRRLWLHTQSEPQSTAYHVPFVIELDGDLSVGALLAALGDVVERHGPLRGVLAPSADGVRQHVRPASEVIASIRVVECATPEESQRRAEEFASRPFALDTEVPIRFRLHRLAGDRHELVVVAHHIALDGLSFAPLVTGLADAYAARNAGASPSWAPLRIGYEDYARWHSTVLDSGVRDRDLEYWCTALDGVEEVPRLPLDRPRFDASCGVGRVVRSLDEDLSAAVRRLASTHDVTVFMVLHAVVAAVTSAVTGSGDTVVGTVDAGRRHPDLEPLVGMFVGTLALRVPVDLDGSFTDLVAAVRTVDVEAFAHSDTPFDEVADHLGGRIPIQVMFSFEGFADPRVDLPGLRVRARELPTRDARFDLEIVARESGRGEIGFEFRFDEGILLADTVRSWASLVCDGLARAVAEPTVALADILGAGTVDNGPAAPAVATLSEILAGPTRIEDAAGTAVDIAPAVAALAVRLSLLGVVPDEFVAVLLPRSVDSIVAATAIARLGAAFVPLDPLQPAPRIAAIIADVGARYVVAAADTDLPAGVVRVDPVAEETVPAPPVRSVHPDSPAYVIYTSGSTGAPKGVVVTHRGLAALAAAVRRAFDVGPDARILVGASPAFDASILEYLLGLGTGATMVVLPPEMYGSAELSELLRVRRITHWFSTPAIPAQFTPDGLDDLRVVGLGGEAWSTEIAARWAAGRTLLNLYGPTEASVVAMISEPILEDRTVPIGRLVDGMSAVVLDGGLRPVPEGAVGELYLAGPGLARGYLGAPGLTAARFVASILGSGRMYRTGDLVRRRVDGQYEFVGRADNQVQIRGIRVELGEIEGVLASHPAVHTAIAALQDDVLVAYVYGPDRFETGALRAYAAERLPRNMVPAVVDVLDHLPLTVGGKIDRSALPKRSGSPVSGAAFRSHSEEIVGRLVADVLSLDAIGRDSDFFALGGNSLLATKLVSRIQSALGIRVDVRDVFEHPTVDALARAIDGRDRDCRPALIAVASDDPVPLSPAQQRMWLLNRVGRSAGDNIAFAVELRGSLDVVACVAALRDVADRHAVLRTVFVEEGEGPVQVVRSTPPEVPIVDCDDEDRLEAALAAMATVGFDLAREAPIRLALHRSGPDLYTLAVVAHHIALDGLSTLPLTRDFVEAYRARRGGAAPVWTPLDIQFTDYARWHRAALGDPAVPGSRASSDLEYWRSVLDPAPALVALPSDRSRRGDDDASGTTEFSIPVELHSALDKVAREYDATIFMVLHAALVVLLHKLSGSSDVTIGTPVSGRTEPALDELAGMFVGTVALRCDVDPRRSFADLLARVRHNDIHAFAHAELPFDEVVADLVSERSRAHHPLFQVMLAYENFVPTMFALPGLEARTRELHSGRSRFDLEVTFREREPEMGETAGLDSVLTFSRELFDRSTVTRWASWLSRILEVVADDPNAIVGAIDLGPSSVLDARAGAITTAATSLGELFVQRARECPEATAVVWGARRVTYRELDDRSLALASALTDAGVGSEDLVALALPRSVDLIAAMVAVVRVGAAYLPLDVTQPHQRLAEILIESRPCLVLTEGAFGTDFPTLRIESIDTSRGSDRVGVVDAPIRSDQVAYVIFTSGSTGTPKGVAVPHAAAIALLTNTSAGFAFGPDDVWTMFHSPAFDFSVWEVWGPLATGGRVVIVDPMVARSPYELRELLVGERVTVVNQTPTAFTQLAGVPGDPDELSVRLLIFGGEPLAVEPIRDWLEQNPKVRAVNMFGITESTVHATWSDVGPDAPERSVIGAPLPGISIELLDEHLRPVPQGAIGEIYLGGAQVARGYLHRPGLTAARFVAAEDGAIRYRTGDLARIRNDGGLEYRGRVDAQLQIRGHRVEPGEVRAALRRIAPVTDAAVLVRDGGLTAYVTSCGDVDERAVIRALRRLLPDYMVPTTVVPVPELPMTPNGKLDVAALAEPGRVQNVSTTTPRNPLEDLVVAVCRDLLATDRVGADDDFFDIGGNSLLATQLAGRLRAVSGVPIDVRDVFENPSVYELARLLERRAGAPAPVVVPAASIPASTRGPLSPAQRRLWFLQRLDPDSTAMNLAFVMRFDGALDVAALHGALHDVVERHRVLRTVYPGDDPIQVVMDTPELDPGLVDVPEDAVDEFVRQLAAVPLRLDSEPPIRTRLYRTSTDRHHLALVVHHIAVDEWSLTLLLRDLLHAYGCRVSAESAELTPPAIEYVDYARWRAETADVDLKYWVEALAGIDEQCTLTHDRPRTSSAPGRAATVRLTVGAEQAQAFAETARRHRITTFMLVHAALAAVLARHTGRADIVVGTAVAGRGDPALDATVGMFASTVVLRTHVDPDASVTELLDDVRRRDVAAFAHGDTPFETIVDEVLPTRDALSHPLFQVALSMRRPARTRMEMPGLTVSVSPRPAETVQYDLQLTVTERAESFEFEFTYDRDVYEHTTVADFAQQMVAFLDAMAGQPTGAVGDIDLMTDAERAELVPARGARSVPESLWQLLSRGAAAKPDGVAIAGAETLTYRELVRRAESLAAVLWARGARPGVPVACVLERSVESVVAVWAVARTGGAPVMIDPANPIGRVEHMLAASGARVGVTSATRRAHLPETVSWLDVTAGATGDVVEPEALPDHPAYVVFTSGTTGRPKGVVLTVRGLGALAADLIEVFGADPASRVLHVASSGFDMALLEVVLAGASGATLVVADADSYAGAQLTDLLQREQVTHACLTPSVLATLEPRGLPQLGNLMLGGEPVSPELVGTWAPGRRLFNGYGPAEATAFATYAGPLKPATRAVIGSPARGIEVVVLDSRLCPVPPGVTGELYLAGDRVAMGYVGDPTRTAERFVAGDGGRRWYRTGDLARWVVDGDERPVLEFRGRNDDQVKIRGVRVEPAELDAILIARPEVTHAVTVMRDGGAGNTVLVSYVAPAVADVTALHRVLVERFPRYMVPATVVAVESIPLTVNGKVDLGRLPHPSLDAPVPAEDPSEELVARVFSELLGHPVGRFDDFFTAGGDSLLATAAVSRLRASAGRDVPLRLLFAEPTVAGLARAMSDETLPGADPGPVARSRPMRIPLSRSQNRMWALRGTRGDSAFRPSVRIEFRGLLDVDALWAACDDVVDRHEALRTTVDTDADGPYAVVGDTATENGAVRMSLNTRGDGDHVLDLSLDHLVVDGGSVAVLFRDLVTAYEARLSGTAPSWDPLPLQYADYVLWERQRGTDALLDKWRTSLAGFDPAVLPTGRVAAPGPASGATVEFGVDPGVVRRLEQLAARFHATEFMVLHAVLAGVLARLTDHLDVGIAAVVSTRRHQQTAAVVGLFVETLVLRSRLTSAMTIGGLLAQVRDFDVAAFDRSGVPFEDVLRAVGAAAPQVALAFQDFTPPTVRVGELEVSAHELGSGAADFEFGFTFARTAEGGYGAVLTFDESRVDSAVARTLADHFATALAVVDADMRVQDLPLTTTGPVDGGRPPRPELLADLLLATAAAHPDRVAVVDGERQLTYRQLDERSDELARRSSGPCGGDVVPIADIGATRSLERIEKLWAAAKSGRAFGAVTAAAVSDGPVSSVDSLAYVIATSGSTGEPKSVGVTHRGLAALAAEARCRYRVGPGDRVLHGYNPAFDAAMLEVLLAHTSGATLVIAPDDVFAGPALHSLLRDAKVSHFLSTPAVLSTLTPDGLPDLRVVASGGESLPAELADSWRAGRVMLDAYGPTESTVVATVGQVDGRGGIGFPIAGTTVFVLDRYLRPVPVGGVGELYLAGEGLARGYLGAPSRTATHFVAGLRETGRMYRTGDRVQVPPDGRMTFLGRADRQLKIRGVRIEPGQVETVLLRSRSVRQAAVIVHGGALVAFVSGPGISPADVWAQVGRELPAALVPTRVHVVDRIPTTANGKVDATRLANLADEFVTVESARPLTASEEVVVGAVREVLGHDVDVDAGFFAVGGHSLAAVEVAARLAAVLRRDVSSRTVLEAPTLAALASRLDEEFDPRPTLLGGTPTPSPMAPAQRRLWLMQVADPGSTAYNVPFVSKLQGNLDTDALVAALTDVVEHHRPLRTVHPDSERQQVVDASEIELHVESEPSTENAVGVRVRELVGRPFDLVTRPPLRVGLFRTADSAWTLVVVAHHIAFDGGSVAPLLRDLELAYEARSRATAPQFAPMPLHYGDFASWQAASLGNLDDPSSVGGRQLDYWSDVLAGMPTGPLDLPADRPRPARPTHHGGVVQTRIGPGVHATLLELARSQGVSTFMVQHAVLAVLLARFGGRNDVTVGTVVDGRPDARLRGLVGMFVGTVALRTPVDPAEGFTDLLRRVRDVDLGAFANSDIPFDDVVARLAPERNPAHHPVFQILLAHTHGAPPPLGLSGIEVSDHGDGVPPAQFDLAWDVTEHPDGTGVEVRVVHAVDLFETKTVERLLAVWTDLLEQVCADPSIPVGDLRVAAPLPARPALPAPEFRTLSQILSKSVRLYPNRVALRAGAQQWTYAELDAEADHRAAGFRRRGIGPGAVVPVDAVRGPDWVLDVWALTRIGAAWVPIDPQQPEDRRRRLLEDALGTAGNRGRSGTDLAYLLFTSGTTGRPKGVAVTHSGLASLVDLQSRMLGVTHESVVLQVASPTFDAAVFELLAAHAHGGELLCATGTAYAGTDLQALIETGAVTHANLTPSVLRTLQPRDFSRTLTVVAAGEPLPVDVAQAWADHRLHNGYGPTECTVGVTCSDHLGRGPVTIGSPIAGVVVRVLDGRLHPAPVGAIGELYVGGPGVARGYHGEPGLTAVRFVADPFGAPGTRLYRTGDLVRERDDGTFDYVGRIDEQVQINGVRVEPTEVDAVLSAVDDVATAVTVPSTRPSGEPTLVSYVVPRSGRPIDGDRLLRHARMSLPRHLVPAAVRILDRIPLTPSGKLDRSALPAPALDVASASGAEPQGPVERVVADAMARVIGCGAVPRDVGFFELGGTSMGAIRFVGALRADHGYAASVGWLADDDTVAGIARRVVGGGETADPLATLVPLRAAGDGAPLFCVHPVGGLAWCYSGLAEHIGARPLYGVQATGLASVPNTVAELASRYVDHVTALQPEGPYHLLGWSLGGNVAHEMAVQLRAAGHDVAPLVLLDSLPPDVVPDGVPEAGAQQPLQDLSGVESETVQHVLNVGTALEAAARTHVPAVFDGDALLFVAGVESDRQGLADLWRRHVAGAVVEETLQCSHAEMVSTEALQAIGRVLQESNEGEP